MFDIKWIRDNPDAFDTAMSARKNVSVRSADLLIIDDRRRQVIHRLNEAQEKRNSLSKQIGQAKAQKDEARAAELMAEVARLKETIPAGEAEERAAEKDLRDALSAIPNMALDDVPVGEDENDNVEYFGQNGSPETAAKLRAPKPSFTFAPKEHFEIGVAEKNMDFEIAAKLSGSRFVVLKGQLARLERALGQFMLDTHTTEHGYTEVQPPVLVRDEALFGTGQLPKFEDDLFFAPHGESRLALIPTAEVPLTNFVRESIHAEEELPRASAPKPARPGVTPVACCASTSSIKSSLSPSPRPKKRKTNTSACCRRLKPCCKSSACTIAS
jgi:seryl-tRNA synthetase